MWLGERNVMLMVWKAFGTIVHNCFLINPNQAELARQRRELEELKKQQREY